MDIKLINSCLATGDIDRPQVFPHLDQLASAPFAFEFDFGLPVLPEKAGILLIRGARQYGKSTWLEQQLKTTIIQFGPASAFYLNGDNIASVDDLEKALLNLIQVFAKDAGVKRIFVDEITSVDNWEMALKRLADQNKLADILIVTTGSKATDLRRGAEKLPGRKGKLDRSTYLFTPISYAEFKRVCGEKLGKKTLLSYLLSGGSPIACTELAIHGVIPEYVVELVRDWIDGEIARSKRSRQTLINIINVLFRFGGTPVGQAKLAREAGLANNTVAVGYIDILNDLGCVVPSYPWDQHRKNLMLRKPCKYHFTNCLAALAYHPAGLRSVADFQALPEPVQGQWIEWLVAQELLRRLALKGETSIGPLAFWQNKQHEIDFVIDSHTFIEVKRGGCTALEFAWFAQQFPLQALTIINKNQFETNALTGVQLAEFLLNAG